MQRRVADRALAAAERWCERADPVADLHAAEASRWSRTARTGSSARCWNGSVTGTRRSSRSGAVTVRRTAPVRWPRTGARCVVRRRSRNASPTPARSSTTSTSTVHRAIVTSANVHELLRGAGVGPEPAVAVLDIDGSDLWVLRAMLRTIAPRLLVVEYNSTFPPGEFWTRRNRHSYSWPETYEHGASLDAMRWARMPPATTSWPAIAPGSTPSSSAATWRVPPDCRRTRSRRSTGRTSRVRRSSGTRGGSPSRVPVLPPEAFAPGRRDERAAGLRPGRTVTGSACGSSVSAPTS